jgi:hypothetical protein
MEIVGGFMVMLSIVGFFLTVLWFILPFVIFAMKGKLDRSYTLLEDMEKRLASLEARLRDAGSSGATPNEPAIEPENPPSQATPPSDGG